MQFGRLAATLWLVAGLCAPAFASTGASLELTGDSVDIAISVDTSSAEFDYGSFDLSLAPGQTVDHVFSYTVKVTDDGLPATRQWTFCTPILDSDCGPAPTGKELAYASVWIGRDTRTSTGDDVWIDDSSRFLSFESVTGQPGLYTGTIDYTATNTSDTVSQSASVTIMAAVFADVATVPEPATAAMMLLALAGLAATQARRARGAAAALRRSGPSPSSSR